MAGLWGFLSDTLGETLGGVFLGPVVIGGVIVSLASSPALRKRVRKWGVQGMGAAMAAGELATQGMKGAGNGTSGVVSQLGQRMVQAASEMREEWEDFLAEARLAKGRGTRSARSAPRSTTAAVQQDNGASDRPRRRVSRGRRPAR